MPKDAFYFFHDSNAKDDPKCVAVIESLGCEGYGIYWVLIETLRDQPLYRYPVALIPALARRYNTTSEKVKAVVMGYGLFEVDDENEFFSPSLLRRMEKLESMREQRSIAGKKSAQARLLAAESTTVQQPLNNRSTTVQRKRVEESRRDKSRGDENKEKIEGILTLLSPELRRAFQDFIDYRKEKKDPLTIRGLELGVAELEKLAADDAEKIAIINQTILRGWKGLFQLKDDVQAQARAPHQTLSERVRDF